VQRHHPKLWWQKTGYCIMTMHHLTLPFSPKATWLLPLPSTPLSSVFPIEDKTERLPFWHKWGDGHRIKGSAEHPQRTPTSRMDLKNWQKHWEWRICT
jgi:hypothetical protein